MLKLLETVYRLSYIHRKSVKISWTETFWSKISITFNRIATTSEYVCGSSCFRDCVRPWEVSTSEWIKRPCKRLYQQSSSTTHVDLLLVLWRIICDPTNVLFSLMRNWLAFLSAPQSAELSNRCLGVIWRCQQHCEKIPWLQSPHSLPFKTHLPSPLYSSWSDVFLIPTRECFLHLFAHSLHCTESRGGKSLARTVYPTFSAVVPSAWAL